MTMPCPRCDGTGSLPDPTGYRAARLAQGWTLKQVADAAGVSISMVHDVENGRRLPSPKIAEAYRKLYGAG